MELLLTILGALGGFESVKWAVTTWLHRRTDARRENASADALENDTCRAQVDWLEKRLLQRDAKIDALYIELRQAQTDLLQLVHEKHALELRLKEAEIRRCDVRGCSGRKPPGDF
ncbi:MAG: hypothetical protein J1E02_07325 [Coprobacter sp.]|nr:hypothetical protein [Coprobacter sp.]